MKTTKISSMFLISVIAIAGIGVSYAGLTDYIQIYGEVTVATVEMEIEIYSGTWVWKVWNDIGVPDGYEDEVFIYRGDVGTEPDMAGVLDITGADYAELISWAKGRNWIAGTDPDSPTIYSQELISMLILYFIISGVYQLRYRISDLIGMVK